MPKSKNAPSKVKSALRREEILRMRAEGATYEQLSQAFGISIRRVRELLDEEMARVNGIRADDAQGLRSEQLEKLRNVLDVHMDKAQEGDLESTGMVLKVMERISKLMGLDAPVKVDARNVHLNLSERELLASAERMGLDTSSFHAPELLGMNGVVESETREGDK